MSTQQLQVGRPTSNVERLADRLRPVRMWHDVTVLRFMAHPELASVFEEYLVGVYHSMCTAGALLEAARLRSIGLASECRVAARLVPYWTQHIREEAGHDEWLLADLRCQGVDLESVLAAPPSAAVAELMGTLHFWVLHTHPVAILAYFYIVEARPPTVAQVDFMAKSAGVDPQCMQTFYRHAGIDVVHGRDLEALIDSLPLTALHHELLATCGISALRQLTRFIEELIARADQRIPTSL